MQELYRWIAQTNSGEVYEEYTYSDPKLIGVDGEWKKEDSFKDVIKENKEGNLKYFMLEPMKKGLGLRSIAVKLGGKRKLIFWRRRVKKKSPDMELDFTIHIVGWEQNVGGTSIKHKMFIYPNGNVETNNDEPTLLQTYIEAYEQQIKDNIK